MIAPTFTRSSDWWEPKITLMVGTGLMVCYPHYEDMSLGIVVFLIKLLLALVAGAVYVSLINDYTDLEEDRLAGKSNRLQKIPPFIRKGLIVISVVIICLFIYLLWDYSVGLGFFIASKLSYSLYSFRPFRLKARGIWGIIADACGAHVFPTLGLVAFLSEFLGNSTDWLVMVIIGVWSFLYGLRGILSHQYWDRDHDISVGGKTFASQFPKEIIQRAEWVIVFVEIFSFVLLLFYLALFPLLILITIYLCYAWLISRYTDHRFVLILQSGEYPNWNILMAAYYQLVMPLTLLGMLAFYNAWFLLAVALFVALFPNEWLKNLAMIKSLYESKTVV